MSPVRSLVILLLAAVVTGCGSRSGNRVQNVSLDAVLLPPEVVEKYKEESLGAGNEKRHSENLLIEDETNFWRVRKVLAIPQPDGTHHFRLVERNSAVFSPLWNEETVATFDDSGRRLVRHYNGGVLFWLLYDHRNTEITHRDGVSERYADTGFLVNLVRHRKTADDDELRLLWIFGFR